MVLRIVGDKTEIVDDAWESPVGLALNYYFTL